MRDFIRSIIISVSFVFLNLAIAADDQLPNWSYSRFSEWGKLSPAFKECAVGKEQSPIDILTKFAIKNNSPQVHFAYKKSKAEVINNGHTIQVNLENGGVVKLTDGIYELVQFHFHTPSEEAINGKHYAMVMHLVHKDSKNKLVAVAVLIKEGRENEALKEVFNAMPAQKDSKIDLQSTLNPADFLPAKPAYYTFKGSLTTPPCTQDVVWIVLKQPIELSKQQIAAFRKIFKMNARPIQPLNGRRIEESL